MEVILLERIKKLGGVGDTVKVKDGFGRNYLLPLKKAIRATEQNKAVFAERLTHIQEENQHKKSAAEKMAEKMNGMSVNLVRQAGEDGRLFGSVTARDISVAIKDCGYQEIGREHILLHNSIKAIGSYEVEVALHPDVIVQIALNVIRPEIKNG